MTEQNLQINESDKIQINISQKDLDLIFKFLSRTELKGFEVPEFNRILEIFNPKNIKNCKVH
jgi:hypothetical protein